MAEKLQTRLENGEETLWNPGIFSRLGCLLSQSKATRMAALLQKLSHTLKQFCLSYVGYSYRKEGYILYKNWSQCRCTFRFSGSWKFLLLVACLLLREDCETSGGTMSSSLASLFKLFSLQSSAVANSIAAN